MVSPVGATDLPPTVGGLLRVCDYHQELAPAHWISPLTPLPRPASPERRPTTHQHSAIGPRRIFPGWRLLGRFFSPTGTGFAVEDFQGSHQHEVDNLERPVEAYENGRSTGGDVRQKLGLLDIQLATVG